MPRQIGVVNSCRNLRAFDLVLSRKRVTFQCPRCGIVLLCKEFQKHCARQHGLNPKRCCVWCWGAKTWNAGEKHEQVDHMEECWGKFMSDHAPAIPRPVAPPPPPSYRPDPILYDTTHFCREQEFFGHEEAAMERLYEPVWPMPLPSNVSLFEDDTLNLAAECVRLFVQGQYEFFHVVVRLVAFPLFLKAMDEDEGRTHTLPFWCLCNGGHWEKLRHRQHRHMIVVSPKGHFHKNVWKKIHVAGEDRPGPHVACIDKRPFRNTLHFINTLGYLSRRESRCEFTVFEGIEPPPEEGRLLNHFYIYTPLPKAFNLPLALQYDNGILEYLHNIYSNFSLDDLLRFPLVYFQRKWRLKIRDLPRIQLGLVMPVTRDLRPSDAPTDLFLHLVNGKKLYFQSDADPDRWLDQQVEGGNLMYHAVGEEYFTLVDQHQFLLTATKPVQDRYIRRESKISELEMNNLHLEAHIVQLENENSELKNENAEKDIRIGQLDHKNTEKDARIAQLEARLAQVENRNVQLEGQMVRFQLEETKNKRRKTS